MASLTLTLTDGSILTGKTYIKLNRPLEFSSKSTPLLVCVHGGSFNCDYFDVNSKQTVRYLSEVLGVPVVAIDRPGYGETPALDGSEKTFIQRHGNWVARLALPAIWREFSPSLNVSSIVLYGQSIGGAVCTVAAGVYADEEHTSLSHEYPLAGLALSGMGCKPNTEPLKAFFADESLKGKLLSIPDEVIEALAAGVNGDLFDPTVWKSRAGRTSTSFEELYDINMQWPTYYSSYAEKIKVQVLYSMGDCDDLWHINRDTMDEFSRNMKNSQWVESRLMKNAPHCIEFSYQCSGFLLRVFGFAIECAEAHKIQEGRDKNENEK